MRLRPPRNSTGTSWEIYTKELREPIQTERGLREELEGRNN